MFKKTILSLSCAALLGAGAGPAFAGSTFHLVVPLNQRAVTPPVEEAPAISVSLAASTLPASYLGETYNHDLHAYLVVTGDVALDPAAARWSLVSGALPAGLSLDPVSGRVTGALTATGSELASFTARVTYKGKESQASFQLPLSSHQRSCAALLASQPGTPSGWYTLDVDGSGPAAAQQYFCDMTSDGGGWTRVARQTEAQPVQNWNGGVNGSSYALATEKIPAHTHIAFGKDDQATFIDYVPGTYQSGDIPLARLVSPKTGITYQLLRLHNGLASFGDPESGVVTTNSDNQWGDGDWRNGLTLDATGGRKFTWTFFPQQQTPNSRGYAMKGSALYTTSESYAWTVWVR